MSNGRHLLISKLFIYNRGTLCHPTSSICLIDRYVKSETINSIGNQMKHLNNRKEFYKALKLFDQYNNDSFIKLSSQMINQAIKACAQLGDLQRGVSIHQLHSSRISDDTYITTSLIHLYST